MSVHGPRTTPIVRALVSEDSDADLQNQRQHPRFGSSFRVPMDQHIAHMRVLGYRYRTEEQRLLRFDRFLQCHPELAGLTLAELVEHWSQEEPSPYHLFEARRAGRMASKAMHRINPRVASTILDRLLHRSKLLEFEGKSYRLREATVT